MMENDFSLALSNPLADNLDLNLGLDNYTPSTQQNISTGGVGDLFTFDNLGKLGSLGAGLAGMFNAYQQNRLRKKAFNFQKAVTNRNIANQAVTVNNQLENQAKMQAQLFGNKVGTAEYSDYLANNQKHVNGSAI